MIVPCSPLADTHLARFVCLELAKCLRRHAIGSGVHLQAGEVTRAMCAAVRAGRSRVSRAASCSTSARPDRAVQARETPSPAARRGAPGRPAHEPCPQPAARTRRHNYAAVRGLPGRTGRHVVAVGNDIAPVRTDRSPVVHRSVVFPQVL
jgi:hypothetical protein